MIDNLLVKVILIFWNVFLVNLVNFVVWERVYKIFFVINLW